MGKTKIYIVGGILFFTFCVILYLVIKANELEQYVIARGIDITYNKGIENYLHIIHKIITSLK